MRKILFRGKTDKGEWVQGDLSQHKTGKKFIKCGSAISSYEVIPETVGQYTGLTDKNGTKIFEGDIVKLVDEYCYYIGEIGWSSTDVRYKFASADGVVYSIDTSDNFEVIGNIHDNPELLGGE